MSGFSRRGFCAAALGAAMLPALPVRADRAPFRVFMVQWRGATDIDRGMRDHLARAGIPVEYVIRDARQSREELARIVVEIKQTRPDLVYAFSTEGALGVVGPVDAPTGAFIDDIPVVFTAVGDPLTARLMHSMPLSGRNVTGVIHLAPVPVQFEAMTAMFAPRRLGVLYNDAETYGRGAVNQLRQVAAKAGVALEVASPTDGDGHPRAELIEPALRRLADARPDALYLPSTSFFIPLAGPITEQATALGLPVFSANEPMIRKGKAMAGLVASFYEVGQLAGFKVEQILTGGHKPAEIPVESLSRFSLLINMQASRQLKIYPPITMLRYAEVINGR